MTYFDINNPNFFPYINGIMVFDPALGFAEHPVRWRTYTITWNASDFRWEYAV